MQEAEEIEPVIDGDDDDVFFLREIRAVVQQVIAGAGREAAAVHPHHDGPRAVVERRRKHVDGEAVLALRRLAIQRRDDRRRLFAVRVHGRGPGDLEVIFDAGPRGRLLRRHETIRTARRRAVRHAPELLHAVFDQTADAAVLGFRRAADRREPAILRGCAQREAAEREALHRPSRWRSRNFCGRARNDRCHAVKPSHIPHF